MGGDRRREDRVSVDTKGGKVINYHDQKACRNCKHYQDIECHGHFCVVDGSEYPIATEDMDWEAREKFYNKLWEWRGRHSVEPSGICSLHEAKEKPC